MVSLGEVLGALISQVNKGRAQADTETVEIAEVYKEDPFLSSFSVPRMTLDEVVIDLKVSVDAGPTRGVSFTPENRKKILDRIETLVNRDLPRKYRYVQSIPKDPDVWKSIQAVISREVSEIIPAEKEVAPESITVGANSAIQRHLVQGLLHPRLRRTKSEVGNFVQEDVPEMEKYVRSEIEKVITEVVETQPPPKDRLEVRVSASDLEGIPPDKITTVRLTLRESDLSWITAETKEGKIEKKLVPL